MKPSDFRSRFILLALLSFPSFDDPAYAYIDPGSGSYMFQLILATALGAAFALKAFWGRVKAFFFDHILRKKVGPGDPS